MFVFWIYYNVSLKNLSFVPIVKLHFWIMSKNTDTLSYTTNDPFTQFHSNGLSLHCFLFHTHTSKLTLSSINATKYKQQKLILKNEGKFCNSSFLANMLRQETDNKITMWNKALFDRKCPYKSKIRNDKSICLCYIKLLIMTDRW